MPTLHEALQLAMAEHHKGQLDKADAIYAAILAQWPDNADAWHLHGLVAYQRGDDPGAEAAIRKAIALYDGAAEYFGNLCEVLRRQRRWDEAIAAGGRSVELDPNFTDGRNNLGYALFEAGQLDAALVQFNAALDTTANLPSVLNNRGRLWTAQGQQQRAVNDFQSAIAAAPDFPEPYNNLGQVLFQQGMFSLARDCFQQAVTLRPDYADAWSNLGLLYQSAGDVERGVECLERALVGRGNLASAWSNRLLVEQYRADVTLSGNRQLLTRWHDTVVATWPAPVSLANVDRRPDRVLRVGLVSADLRQHPLAAWIEPVIRRLNRQSFQVICFSHLANGDEVTDRLRSCADRWHDIYRLDHQQVFDLIRREQIDLLFDLSGHTAGNRLEVFQRRAAPVQLSWLGFLSSSGLPAIDYLIGDETLTPVGCEFGYSERILRLARGYACFQPPADAPEIGPTPESIQGHITFGSLNNPAKLTNQVLDAWGAIMQAVPSSQLVMGYRGCDDPLVKDRVLDRFQRAGIAPDRLKLRGYTPRRELLNTYNTIDVALDPYPFNGFTTTIEALYMGVPVVTVPGETMPSRQSLFVLERVGLTETVAQNWDDYVRIALRLAHDRPRRTHWRQTLRQRVEQADCCHAERFLPALEDALREVWRRWCMTTTS